MLFNTQLMTLLHAGMPLAQSLELLKDQQSNPHFRALLEKVHQQVTTGVSLSDAFLSLGDTFPRLYANSLRAGERTGELEQVIGRFVDYQRLVETVRKKIIAAMTYPAVLVTLAIGLIIILMTYVIPTFSDFYVQFESELPLPTQLVIGIANNMRDNLVFIIAGAVGGVVRAAGVAVVAERAHDHRSVALACAGGRAPVAPFRDVAIQPFVGHPARRRDADGTGSGNRGNLGEQHLHRRALSRVRAGGAGGPTAVRRPGGHRPGAGPRPGHDAGRRVDGSAAGDVEPHVGFLR